MDLIRSDLLGCCVPSTVQVPKLIAVETYGVHNLVTTVQGNLASNVGQIEAVKRCFPPGSMTGAPKLRSVQLLDDFEHHQRRGIYSGALGYISVDGATDLSVVIRTIVIEGSSEGHRQSRCRADDQVYRLAQVELSLGSLRTRWSGTRC